MRTVSATALAKAQANDGVESMCVVELDTGAGMLYFGDRELGGVEDRIKSLGNVNISLSSKGASVGSVAVELDDTDEYFLNLLCTTRLEGRVARILQVFDGDLSDAIELMVGRVGSPVTWEEEDRCFKFDIVAFYRSADNEVPYAPEETSDLAEAAWNKPWPRIYGLPIDVPATQVTFAPQGQLIRELQPMHGTFDIEVADEIEFPLGEEITVQVGNEYITGSFEELSTDPVTILRFTISGRNVSKGEVYSFDRSRLSEIEEPPPDFERSWESDPRYAAWDTNGLLLAGNWLWLIDGPSGIGAGAVTTGGWTTTAGTVNYPTFVGNKNYILYQKGDATRGQLPWFGPTGLMFIGIGSKADIRGVLDVNDTLWPAGTKVEQIIPVKYVVSDLPCDAVHQVRAWRDVKLDERGGRVRQLVTLPEDFYTLDLNDVVDGRACTTIEFVQSLGSRNSGWDNDVYVTAERGDGNIATIITELLEDADLVVDTGEVATQCAAYPMNFAILSRRDSLELAYDIAWQGRCGLSVLGSTAVLVYLSEEPTAPLFAYADENVLEGTLQLTTSETSEVVNDLWVRWRKRYSQSELNKLHYKNADSIDAYGRQKNDLEIYAYRHKALVQKTATFWFNRWSRVWRKMRVVTDLDSIQLTPFDDVRSVLVELETLAMVESCEHDTDSNSIAFMLWTPVEVGTCVMSDSAYLDDAGDSAPGTPSFSVPSDVSEVIEVSPLDLGLTNPEVHVGEATTDEVNTGPIYGEFDAKLYKTNENTGEVIEGSIRVKNLSPGTPIKAGTVLSIFKAEDGTYYAAPGGSSNIYYGSVTATGSSVYIDVDIYSIVDDDYEFVENAAVFWIGETQPEVGADIAVFKASDGTYWATGSSGGGATVGMAKVKTSTTDKTSVSCRLYNGSVFSGTGDSDITVSTPALSGTITAGTWMIVYKVGSAWVGYLPLIRPRT